MWLIGREWKYSDVWSGPVLIDRGLDLSTKHPLCKTFSSQILFFVVVRVWPWTIQWRQLRGSTCSHVLDEGQITNIALRKACRDRGYGELLLRLLMEAAWKRGCSVIFLEVRFSNLPALHLYRKLGYTVVSVRKQYYTQPTEDAYVMSCEQKKYHWADK